MPEEQIPSNLETDTQEQAAAFERCVSILQQMDELTGEEREVREEEKENVEMRQMLGDKMEELSRELKLQKTRLSKSGLKKIIEIQNT